MSNLITLGRKALIARLETITQANGYRTDAGNNVRSGWFSERVAAAAAVAAGHRKITAVAVATTGGAAPCGACRQFLAEFGGNMDVLLVDVDRPENVKQISLADLLPEQFSLDE